MANLQNASNAMSQTLYAQQQQAQQGAQQQQSSDFNQQQQQPGGQDAPHGQENVVDAEYEVIYENKKNK